MRIVYTVTDEVDQTVQMPITIIASPDSVDAIIKAANLTGQDSIIISEDQLPEHIVGRVVYTDRPLVYGFAKLIFNVDYEEGEVGLVPVLITSESPLCVDEAPSELARIELTALTQGRFEPTDLLVAVIDRHGKLWTDLEAWKREKEAWWEARIPA